MSEPAALYEKRDGIARVTMNRPEVRNALNTEMLCRLADAWQDINDDPAVRVAVFTGAGDKAFCAGADLDKFIPMMQGRRPTENEWDERILKDIPLLYKGLLRNYLSTSPSSLRCVASPWPVAPRCCRVPTSASPATTRASAWRK